MTVTISIPDNETYCRENLSDQIKQDEPMTCQCVQHGVAWDDCSTCKGTGYLPVYDIYPFKMEMTTRNFVTMMGALGLDVDPNDLYGDIVAQKVLSAIDGVRLELMTREQGWSASRLLGTGFDCGIDLARAAQYIKELHEIAMEAARREEPVFYHG